MKKTSVYKILFAALSIFSASLIWQQTLAHEGEDHGAKPNTQPVTSDHVDIGKESQFLLGILTQFSIDTPFSNTLQLMGRVVPSTSGSAEVVVPQTARVVSINVKVGEQVKKGQVLATVEQNLTTTEQINIATQKTQINAELQDARNDYNRLKSIGDIVAKKDLQQAEVRLKAAQESKRIFDNINSAKVIQLRAPVSGTIGNFVLSTGSQVQAGQPLFTIVDLSKVWVEIQLFEKDRNSITKNSKFRILSAQNDITINDAKLVSVSKTVDPANQSTVAILEIDNAAERLSVGQYVKVFAESGNMVNAVVVPNDAITEIAGKPVVFTHDEPESFHIHEILPGESNGKYTAILNGLKPNERVVTSGTYQVKSIFLNQ
ncbi:MAG: efflux RND transporter periplasmic adaptor subunit [Bacteroidia bacterium]